MNSINEKEILCSRLKELRKNKKVTQEAVANFLKIGRTGYVKIENGIHKPDINTLRMLALYFNVSIHYLLGVDDVPRQPLDQNVIREILGMENKPTLGRSPLEQKVVDLYNSMPPEMQKAAIAQLEALAALNKK